MNLRARTLRIGLATTVLMAAIGLAAACPRGEAGKPASIKAGRGKGAAQEKPAPDAIFVSGGKLVIQRGGAEAKPLSAEGKPLVPVTSFDVNQSAGEVALACGGKAGVVPLAPKPAAMPEAEEWYDLRMLAGSDAFVSLVRLSPDAITVYALIYHATSMDEGFRLLAINRQTGQLADIPFPTELRTFELREIKFDGRQAPCFLLYDQNTPASHLYRLADGKVEHIFSTEDALEKLDLEEDRQVPASMAGIYAIDLADFFFKGNGVLLPVQLLVEGEPAQEGRETVLVEQTELWELDLDVKKVVKRLEIQNDDSKPHADFAFALADDALYFARLSFPEEPKPLPQPQSDTSDGESTDGVEVSQAIGAREAADEPKELALPNQFTLMKLNLAEGRVSMVASAPLGPGFYGMLVFPDAEICAALAGTDEKLTVDVYSFSAEKLQSGLAIDSPNIFYFSGV